MGGSRTVEVDAKGVWQLEGVEIEGCGRSSRSGDVEGFEGFGGVRDRWSGRSSGVGVRKGWLGIGKGVWNET